MRKLVVVFLIVALAVAFAAPATSAVQPLGNPGKTTPNDLPVMQLPSELLAGGQSSPTGGNPQGTPPGQAKKPPPGPTANKWAVVVGIADYQGTGYDLWHPDEDAKEMRDALINKYGFPKDNIKILLNRKATANAILSAIDWLAAKEDAQSTVVFFFSGHGFTVADAEGWDADAEWDEIDEGIVSHDFYGLTDGLLREKFSAFETQKFALVFGSCYSGGMFDDLNVDLRAPGRVIASACKADQYAWDYLRLGNTLFGYYFVDEGILDGKAERSVPADGVSMEEALAYAYPLVTAEQPKSQPQIYDGYYPELIP
ncbi:MAG: caspase family protein [Dehalococcoidia bacterium]|nr:caspase family protein [Dehalococcoidia bacterium]